MQVTIFHNVILAIKFAKSDSNAIRHAYLKLLTIFDSITARHNTIEEREK